MYFNSGFSKKIFKAPDSEDHWFPASNPSIYGSGRAAFIDVIRTLEINHGVNRIFVPSWICSELIIAIQNASKIQICIFSVGPNFIPEAIKDGKEDSVLILVDYFATPDAAKIEEFARTFPGWVIFDCVHSWPVNALNSSHWPVKFIIIGGFRKLFWKIIGAFVLGHITPELPKMPTCLAGAAPKFPRNISLSPRWGLLSGLLLKFIDFKYLDQIARAWPVGGSRNGDFIASFRSPVCLKSNESPASVSLDQLSDWPDLWAELTPDQRQNAEALKATYPVCWRKEIANP
ncbi:MAG: hypothetical protein NTV34_19370 [Proteobacteria bacterium]|nr:hypothetical protein [Pseudomonadota bacterium]